MPPTQNLFTAAEAPLALSKSGYKEAVARLRVELLDAQKRLAESDLSLVLIVGGVEGAGKTEFANRLLTWLDARGVETHALGEPTDEEGERPPFWRFWRLLPAAKRAALFLTSWYTEPIVARVFRDASEAEFEARLRRVAGFERMLARENVVLVKLWFHLSKKAQKRRFKELEKDPATRWRVTALDWKYHKKYGRFRRICARALRRTWLPQAPWRVIGAEDRRRRDVEAGREILKALRQALASHRPAPAPKPLLTRPKPGNVLRKLDLSLALSESQFEKRLDVLQGKLGVLTRGLRGESRSLIVAFEGPDAAGKGGAIRRLAAGMDARLYEVRPISAPSDEERAHPYLWRFWRALPRLGRVAIYDRTWYGRVLVERVEGFAPPAQWRRAYGEINAFEEELCQGGAILVKFWIAISPREQLRRFEAREETPYKQYKLTREDWRNRRKWDAYEAAACEMIARTGTERAPWTLVEGENKLWARVKVLETVVERLEAALR